MKTGSCLCGAVAYEVHGPLRASIACHCNICRRLTGHYWSATQALTRDIHLREDRGLKWFDSSDIARRAFCQHCGSNLFYREHGSDYTSIGTGTLDKPTGLQTEKHICLDEKGDYYEVVGAGETTGRDNK
ncbi:GFA family protein [Natronospirillum operosum]|uniref:GFA family protein n=1 Tax=Natronospirillum operosum TaxID=2759953 RepID=A0A4Z0WB77_9GAMM|nr:GFA family protein [Natronospirillum operosum]TGG91746.1 GFA family protein [Natronospirillum operosum]